MITLAVDTATTVAVGVARDDEVLATGTVDGSRAHAEQLMPTITDTVRRAGITLTDVDRVVVGLGPGPFTGLRVGIVTARTLALALGADWRGVCTLDALAAQCDSPQFVIATDARRRELYWAHYRDGKRIAGPAVGPAGELPDVAVIGPAAQLYPDTAERGTVLALDPGVLAVSGWDLPDVGTEPLYLRRPDATVSTRRKSALPVRRRR